MSGRRGRGGGGGDGGHGGGGEERWLLPYSDMITLLLGLFIVLFAMSTIDAKQFEHVKRSLSQTFNGQVMEEPGGVLPGASDVLDPTSPADSPAQEAVEISEATRRAQKEFDQETTKIERIVKDTALGNDVEVSRTEVGIKVRIAGDALFESGEYRLREGIRDDLRRLEAELQRFNRPIEIAGHTDGAPMGGEFGNYGLAGDRAEAVRAFFLDLGYPRSRMYTVSHGSDEPFVEPPSKTSSVRENRRIEITILEPGAHDGFPNPASTAEADHAPAAEGLDPKAAEVEAEVDRQLSGGGAGGDLVGELAAASRGLA